MSEAGDGTYATHGTDEQNPAHGSKDPWPARVVAHVALNVNRPVRAGARHLRRIAAARVADDLAV